MTDIRKPFSIGAAVLVAGLGAAFAASGASQADSDAPRCEIIASTSGGTASIRGVVHADRALSGEYSFTVSGQGTNIRQGGAFEAQAGETATLGSVQVGGSARSLDIRLELNANGQQSVCEQTLGSI
ncbi:curli-like amyloid fiber formation chaperone CsgH [Mesorhizobium sp. CAU 1732]|uniref:curli-like amyloid fiber formation chaperone CsgH n=1 Tax=Mesorhizobium sp. CAU 1732 TaxID=3140358 RepID=UPI0032601450